MSLAIRIRRTGGPEVLEPVDEPLGVPGPGEVALRHTAIGLNFIDVYHRIGHYPGQLPSGLGMEAAGVVTALGPGVQTVRVGDRVAYAGGPLGAYAAERLFPAERLVPVPPEVTDAQAAAVLLKGLTAQYLVCRTFPVQSGQTVVVHAAAGGVGLLLCQWLRHLGATVIGTVSTPEKAALAREHGCTHPFVLDDQTRGGFVQKVVELTFGKKVPVVYDSVGQDTFALSLDVLAPLGMLVVFGSSSGAVPPFNVGVLAQKGSLFLTRPMLMTYTARREDLLRMSAELFDLIAKGVLAVEIRQTYPLADVARAHRDLEGRRTTGSTVLTPG